MHVVISPRFHRVTASLRSLRARPGLGDDLLRSRRQLRVVVLARVPPPVGKGQAVPADVRLLVGAGAAVVVRPDIVAREDQLAGARQDFASVGAAGRVCAVVKRLGGHLARALSPDSERSFRAVDVEETIPRAVDHVLRLLPAPVRTIIAGILGRMQPRWSL